MNFMIRILILIFISSCTSTNIFFDTNTLNENYKIKQTSDEGQMLLVSSQKNKKSVFKLIKTGKYKKTWSDGSKSIETLNGKVINSYGFSNNIELILSSSINKFFYNKNLINTDIRIFSDLKDSNYLSINYINSNLGSTNFINIKGNEVETLLLEEFFEVKLLKWKGKNLYWIDEGGKVIKSKQALSPFGPVINIEHI